MGFEASKTKEILTPDQLKLFSGEGIDIGCGPDPIMPNAKPFDIDDGDANCITQYVDKKFDYVFSSHCLEHMHDPVKAILEWWQLLKPSGYLIFTVPDEDLYEQGYFPSLFNDDHKSTFTISKKQSWSPRSYNLLNLIKTLPNHQLITIELQDHDYKRKNLYHSVYSRNTAYQLMQFSRKLSSVFTLFGLRNWINNTLHKLLRLPIDQTHSKALAQIFVIIQKTEM